MAFFDFGKMVWVDYVLIQGLGIVAWNLIFRRKSSEGVLEISIVVLSTGVGQSGVVGKLRETTAMV